MSEATEELRGLCQGYIADMAEAAKEDAGLSNFVAVVLSGNNQTRRCSAAFADKAESLFARIDGPEELAEAADYILDLAIEYRDNTAVGLMFTALLSFVTPKIPASGLPNAESLRRRVEGAFPPRMRTPVLKDFLKRLG